MIETLEKVSKGYVVAHRDEINREHLPESEIYLTQVPLDKDAKYAIRAIIKKERLDYDYIDMRARRRPKSDMYMFEGKAQFMSEIKYTIDARAWREAMQNLVNNNKGRKVYIRTGQFGMYWRSNRMGYTPHRDGEYILDLATKKHVFDPGAGVYDIEDAWKRTAHCGLEKEISFEFIEEPTK